MDGVQAANSGHPGTPMALAPVTYVLWTKYLRYDPDAPLWPARDRFILSCGHASMLLYSMLHLAGVKRAHKDGQTLAELAVPLEDIRRFRQWESVCPGHPEYGETTGVETTTGPLGQGVGNSVGMAAASRWLGARYDRPGFNLFDYNVYALCSDGDLMEGIGCEAASLAGHLKLSNLCWIYDDNHITIEGHTNLAFSEDVGRRFEGVGWHVVKVADANDLAALGKAFEEFQRTSDRPTLIIVRSQIGYGSPNKANTHGAHGAPLGEEEVRLTKRAYGWPEDQQFLVPDEVPAHFQATMAARGQKLREDWDANFKRYAQEHPELAEQCRLMRDRELPQGWDAKIPVFETNPKGVASRVSSGKVLNAVAEGIPWLVGGSADLAPSTMTQLEFAGADHFSATSYQGRNFHFGVREHAMAAAVNGMTLSGLRAFGATFFVFTDYCRPSLRMAAIMRIPSIFIFTHDSIGVGEDGPTHQPIEHLAALRAMPNMAVFRPGDANEVAAMWKAVLPLQDRPVSMVLSRQNLPTLDRGKYASADGAMRGAYVLADASNGKPELILIATGSELGATVDAYEKLVASGVKVRVVSMPCWEFFEQQDAAYRESVLPSSVTARVAVEAGCKLGWERYLGAGGVFIGMDHYGASAPAGTLMKRFGFTAEHIMEVALKALGR